MHGLVVIEGMTLSGHPWIINEIKPNKFYKQIFTATIDFIKDNQRAGIGSCSS